MNRSTLITSLLRLLARLPLWAIHALGAGLGWILWLFPNQQRRVAAVNLGLCFPELSPWNRQRLLRRNLMETAKAMLELGPLWLWDGRYVLELIRDTEGAEGLRQAVAQGRGAITVTPHLGAWEVAGLWVSAHYPITTLYRPSRVGIDPIIRQGRERLGARTVPTDTRGVRALFQALKNGQVLGILPDQDPGRDNGVFASFFGQDANTMALLSRLAMKSGAPVFMVTAERLPLGRGYRLRVEAFPAAVNHEPLALSVAAVNAAVEQAVRHAPEQYLWSYKRFKTRPPGESTVYP